MESASLKFVLTGSTGFVGQQLAPKLREAGGDLILVSRNAAQLLRDYPDFRSCDYTDLRLFDLRDAIFIHAAVLNNSSTGTEHEFWEANVKHLLDTAYAASKADARCFINLASTHALDPSVNDVYGRSKAQGANELLQKFPKFGINLYLPTVYGQRFKGRLEILNRLPSQLRPWILSFLRLAKPMVSSDIVAKQILDLAAVPKDAVCHWDRWSREFFVADPVPKAGLHSAIKRATDILAAVTLVIVFGWLMIAIWIWIKFDSRGPGIFAQQRVGQNGIIFTCYKFRTMATDTVQAATHEVSEVTVTRAGRFLRRTKLDELPQCINILRNEMSLVGPRPCLPVQEELVAARERQGVLTIKPGITGLAQIRDIDMSNPSKLANFDARYRAFRTVLSDLQILVATLIGRGRGDPVGSAATNSGFVEEQNS